MNRKALRNTASAILIAAGLLITPLAWGQGDRFESAGLAWFGGGSHLEWLKELWWHVTGVPGGRQAGTATEKGDGPQSPPESTNGGICAPGEHGVTCDPDG